MDDELLLCCQSAKCEQARELLIRGADACHQVGPYAKRSHMHPNSTIEEIIDGTIGLAKLWKVQINHALQAQDQEGRSALMAAASAGQTELVEDLLERGKFPTQTVRKLMGQKLLPASVESSTERCAVWRQLDETRA